jgi:DNA-binding transcriptional regulator YhcF (GntR family)
LGFVPPLAIRFGFSCIQVYNSSMATIRRAKTPIPPFESARKRGDRLFERLREDILCGRMLPGEALSETRLAEQHGISRTPVREVIQRLAKEDLLAIVPQIGTFVAPIKLASVTNSQFIREAIECRAVRFATERATRPQVETLRQQVARQKSAIENGNPAAKSSARPCCWRSNAMATPPPQTCWRSRSKTQGTKAASGTKRTKSAVRTMSVFEGKADIPVFGQITLLGGLRS